MLHRYDIGLSITYARCALNINKGQNSGSQLTVYIELQQILNTFSSFSATTHGP